MLGIIIKKQKKKKKQHLVATITSVAIITSVATITSVVTGEKEKLQKSVQCRARTYDISLNRGAQLPTVLTERFFILTHTHTHTHTHIHNLFLIFFFLKEKTKTRFKEM